MGKANLRPQAEFNPMSGTVRLRPQVAEFIPLEDLNFQEYQ